MNKYEVCRQREINNQNELLLQNLISIANRRLDVKRKLKLKQKNLKRPSSGQYSTYSDITSNQNLQNPRILLNVEMQPQFNPANAANMDLNLNRPLVAYSAIIPEVFGSDSSKNSPSKLSSGQLKKHDYRSENRRYKLMVKQKLIDFENLRLYRQLQNSQSIVKKTQNSNENYL